MPEQSTSISLLTVDGPCVVTIAPPVLAPQEYDELIGAVSLLDSEPELRAAMKALAEKWDRQVDVDDPV